jgi:hypothetical protein
MRLLLATLFLFFVSQVVHSQTLCTGSLGDPIINITFGSGPGLSPSLPVAVPGASTTYQFIQTTGAPVMPVPLDGTYTICHAVPNNTPWFAGKPDHTPGDVNGYMAHFSADPSPAEFYRQTVTGLCENTKYEFASWVANALDPAVIVGQKPDITFIITKTDGTVLGTLATGPISQPATFTWQQFGFFFTTPPGVSSVILKMINTNPGGAAFPGNDFEIDDITFRPCGPIVNASFSSTVNQGTASQCGLAPVTVFGSSIGSSYTSPAFLWQYSLTNGASWIDIPSSNATSISFTPTAPGNYLLRMLTGESVNIATSTCRVASNQISLLVYASPQGSFSGNSICGASGAQLAFAPTGGTAPFSVTYTDGVTPVTVPSIISATTIAVSPAPTATTTYTLLSITDANGCVRTSSFTNPTAVISVVPLPVASTIGPVTVCSGDSVQLTASGGMFYSWTPVAGLSNPAVANPNASPAASITYHVVVSNAPGCSDGSDISVTVLPRPSVSILPANPFFCPGDSVQLTSTGAFFYQWSPASGLSDLSVANPKAAPALTTTYRLIGSFPTGCRDTVYRTVTRNPSPVISVTPASSVCLGDSLQLNATGGAVYSWSPSSGVNNTSIANPKASPAITTNYRVLVSNSSGCTDSGFVLVTVKSNPAVTIAPSATICNGDSLQLMAGGGLTYQWSPTTCHQRPFFGRPEGGPVCHNNL